MARIFHIKNMLFFFLSFQKNTSNEHSVHNLFLHVPTDRMSPIARISERISLFWFSQPLYQCEHTIY